MKDNKKARSFLIALAALFALSILTGCAVVDQKISLNYSPVDYSFGRHSGELAVSRIDTGRVSVRNSFGEWIVGSINNANGVHSADLVSDRSPGEWITDALLLELKHAGYTVTYTPTLPPAAPGGVLVRDISAFMDINRGTVSDEIRHELKFNVDIFRNGERAKSLSVASRDNRTIPLYSSRELQEQIMLRSLQDTVQQILPEVTALTDKK